MRQWLWSGRPWQAFKNFALIFSFVLNLLLVSVMLILATLILPFIRQTAGPVVGGLSQSFAQMRDAHIERTFVVQDSVPIQLILPISTETTATIVEPVPMAVTTNFVLPGGGGTINGTVFFELPAGTGLPVAMDLVVPISQTVPLDVAIDVDIPLAETELSRPLDQLMALFAPLERFLLNLPADSDEFYRRVLDNDSETDDDGLDQGLSQR